MARTTKIEIGQSPTGFTLSPHDVTSKKNSRDFLIWEVVGPVTRATITVPLPNGSQFPTYATTGKPAKVELDVDLILPVGEQPYAVYCESNTLKGYVHSPDPKIIIR